MSFCDDEVLYEHDDAPYLREDVKPKFELLGVSHELEEDIQSLDIQNDVTAILGVRGSVIIRESEGSAAPQRANVRQGYKMFLHPQGTHALVSTLDGHLHYFNVKTKRANTSMLLQQLSGGQGSASAAGASTASNVAECVYWGSSSDAKSTGTLLVGTRTGGLIFEVRFDFANGETTATCRQVLSIPGAAATPVTGIDAVTLKDETIVVLITTPTKLCRIEGGGDARKTIVDNGKSMLVTDMPTSSENPARGSLSVFRSVLGGNAQSYAWSSSAGVVHGLFAQRAPPGSEDAEDVDVDLDSLVNQHMIALHRRSSAGQSTATKLGLPDKPPTEVVLTAFHMVLLFDDRVIVLNHPAGLSWRPLNGQDLQEVDIADRIKFDPFRYRKIRRLQGVFRDVAQRKLYLYNATNVWELLVEHEHFTQWRLFLERAIDPTDDISLRKRFYAAAHNLSKHNKHRRDLVAYSRGMFYLHQLKDPESATTLLAACDRFEDIYVQLTQQRSVGILRKFLEKRYALLVASGEASKPGHKAQVACLIMHLVQLKLDNISKCEGDGARTAAAVKDLDNFLTASVRRNPDIFQDQAFYHMVAAAITCQGRIPTMLHFAELLQRVHYTISFHLSQREYRQACELLIRYGAKENSEMAEAWYDFAPIIIENCPVRLITGLLRAVIRHSDGTQEHLLDIERLIPAFIRYHPKLNEVPNNSEHQVILFLERCIEKLSCVSPVVHNYYVSLLAQHDPERLLEFFTASDDEHQQYFSTEFALRRCLELHRFQHCIPLYKKLGLYEDAICIAMEISTPDASGRWEGLQNAKEILHEADAYLDFATKKKLWMMVAERVIEKIGTKQALSIVEDSNGVLKLEDVLAKINDNTVIQNFKEAVCRSLDEYTSAISDLNQQQREAFQMSESVKREIRELKNRYGFVTSKQKCHLCQKGLLQGSSPFLVFPGCRHVFHEGCVVKRLESLGGLDAFRCPGLPQGYLDGIYSLDDLAQSECVFCGECAILEITHDYFEEGADPSWSTD